MIELLTADTPNGKKISIMLEEIKFDYKVTKINIFHVFTLLTLICFRTQSCYVHMFVCLCTIVIYWPHGSSFWLLNDTRIFFDPQNVFKSYVCTFKYSYCRYMSLKSDRKQKYHVCLHKRQTRPNQISYKDIIFQLQGVKAVWL